MSVTINGTNGLTFNDASTQNTAATGFGFKNRIINGAMQIAQRATSATITAGSTIAAGYSTVDRFYVYCTGANVTAAQVAGSGAIKNNLQKIVFITPPPVQVQAEYQNARTRWFESLWPRSSLRHRCTGCHVRPC